MFKFIFIFLLILIFVPTVRRFLFWMVVGKEIAKEKKRQNDRYDQAEYRQREGEIRIDKNTPKSSNNKSSGGQYVDYEEVKD
ncbi:MAG: DUF4834 family protein [Leadbetterella sp.]